jgi:hypothetical protein
MHGFVEAAVSHLLLTRLNNPALAKIIPKLETNNARTGKLAFVKAYKLLSDDACLFVNVLSEVRNRAVHDIKHFDIVNYSVYFLQVFRLDVTKIPGQRQRCHSAVSIEHPIFIEASLQANYFIALPVQLRR